MCTNFNRLENAKIYNLLLCTLLPLLAVYIVWGPYEEDASSVAQQEEAVKLTKAVPV